MDNWTKIQMRCLLEWLCLMKNRKIAFSSSYKWGNVFLEEHNSVIVFIVVLVHVRALLDGVEIIKSCEDYM